MAYERNVDERRLSQDAREVLDRARALTHGPLYVREDKRESYLAHVKVAADETGAHVVRYDPAYRKFRDHLISHEALHLIRIYSAPEDGRIGPYVEDKHRRNAVRDMATAIEALERRGVPDELVASIARSWHVGTVSQLMNFPSDMRIERELFERYPNLRDTQKEVLRLQLERNAEGVDRRIERITPRLVYESSHTMSSALDWYASRLFGEPLLDGSNARSRYRLQGQKLAEPIWSTPDSGHAGDVAASDEWAKTLALRGWFDWRRLGLSESKSQSQ